MVSGPGHGAALVWRATEMVDLWGGARRGFTTAGLHDDVGGVPETVAPGAAAMLCRASPGP